MDLSMNQGTIQLQKQILTPQMQHFLNILQMPIFDLQIDIAKQLEKNPLLEIKPNENVNQDQCDFKDLIDSNKYLNREYMPSDHLNYNPDKILDPLNFIIEKRTLKEFLCTQLVDLKETPQTIFICHYIIENIDERGYLSCSVEDMVKDLNSTVPKVQHALELVQGFEPDGVAARNITECLRIQLLKKGVTDEKLYEMIEHYLEYIAENKIKKLSCILHVSVKKIQDYCNIIKSLEPKPSRGFYTGNVDYFIIPEAYIRKIDNELAIVANDTALPKLTINKLYQDILIREKDKNIKSFVKSNLTNALNLINVIEQRNSTILKILYIIVEKQKDYFYYGPHYLKPMIIGEIADQLELNESTVSRAIKDKYISTPHATVKIRDLFTNGFKSYSNDNVSSNSIKAQISNLIHLEDKRKPLSDEEISKTLKETGLSIARRTVAKYREELEIPSSNKRKVFT